MIDLHTHILPGVDDGAQTLEESLEMLREQARQGVHTVALTPHYYSKAETVPEFLAKRDAAWNELCQAATGADYPKLILGAEVAWTMGMHKWPDLQALCYQNTKLLLVELPVLPWTSAVFQELYRLENRSGVMPVIAHLDRYLFTQNQRDINKILEMGYPIQVSAEALFHVFSRKKAWRLLKDYDGLLISDCHNMTDRKPNIEEALRIAERKLGREMAVQLANMTHELLED